jgi:peptidyl-prolyl cis-trans isomerase SurA
MNKTRRLAFAFLFTLGIVFASGCGGESQDGAVPDLQAGNARPEQTPATAEEPPEELSAAHILVMHKESQQAPPEITRSKEEALALIKEIAAKAKAEGGDFAALAKEYSDCPSGAEGGNLGNFPPDAMVPAFSQAALKLAVGEMSDPVETPFGYHIILRQEIQVIAKASAKHILVQYQGSMMAPETVTRTKEEALARIQECLKKSGAGRKFEDLAREYSDCPSAAEGGDLGEFSKGMMHPLFDAAVFPAEVGKITEIVETPFGYHIIYRYK